MGAVRFLCITILLVALAVAAPDCNSNGKLNAHGDCVCNSGFHDAACGTNFGTDTVNGCNINAAAPLERKDDRFPVLDDVIDTISFRQNILKLAIAGEIVPSRQYDNIVFVQGGAVAVADKCKLHASAADASYWTQVAQNSNGKCRDSFVLHMPWTSWQDCGFTLSASESTTYWVYRATFVITYTDALGKPFDIPDSTYKPDLVRHSSVAYKIYVRFLKSVEIEVNEVVTVNNTVALRIAITKFEYDPSTMKVTMGISTIVRWPNMLLRNTMQLAIQAGTATTSTISFDGQGAQSGLPTNPTASQNENDVTCVQDKYNNCLQYFEFDIHLDSGCDFNAVYIVSATVATCRDHPLDCTSSATESFVTIGKSDVCGAVTAEPLITGKLMSYDQTHNPKTEFELGYRGYFEVDITSANDFNLTWVDIWVVADMDIPNGEDVNSIEIPKIQWLYRNGQKQTNNFHKYDGTVFPPFTTSPVDLKVYDVTRNTNAEVIFTPKFDFRFDSRIFHIPLFGDGIKKGYTLHAKGKIVYANNEQYGRKRTEATEEIIDFVWKTDKADLDSTTRFGVAKEGTLAAEINNPASTSTNAALLASLIPVAGIALVVIAAAIIAAVIIVKKRNASSSFATLN